MSQMPKNLVEFIAKTGVKPDEEYIDNSQKMKWVCPKGCSFVTTWKVVQHKKGCILCNDNRRMTYEQIHKSLQEMGAKLLTEKPNYQNSYSQKLEIICDQNHINFKTFKAYRSHGCSVCNPKQDKYDIEELQKIALSRGDTILSKEYVNAHTPLLMKCANPKHDPYPTLWTTYNRDNIRSDGSIQKTQCRQCAYETLKVNFTIFKHQIITENYRIIKYDGDGDFHSKYSIKVQCDKNHNPYVTTWNRWQDGKRCPDCPSNTLKSIDEVKTILAKQKLTLLNDCTYRGNKTPIKAVCEKGHITWKGLQGFERYGCSECSTAGTSNIETQIIDYFKKNNPIHKHRITIPNDLKLDDRTKSIELDIYFPEYKLAIEYCGLYWHSSKRIKSLYWDNPDELSFYLKRNRYRHQYKKQICSLLGINLLTIFEDEYLGKKDIVLSRIAHKLGILQPIYARQCDISEITKEEAKDFFDSFHLQQNVPFEYGLKLRYCNQIVSAMTFRKPLPSNSVVPNDWELKRYCCLPTYQITGGAQRLFKHALDEARNRSIPAIFTYCDLRWGTGNIYKSLGFQLIREMSKPSPHIVKGIHRSRSHKKLTGDENLIYDCGHQKWLIQL